MRDAIYATPQEMSGFIFDEAVAQVFPDMLRRSVPGYQQLLAGIGLWAGRYARPQTNIYDLGCSLGAATWSMRERIPHDDCHMIAIDNSPAMIERCDAILNQADDVRSVECVCADITAVPITNASVIVLNLTLQFVPMQLRPSLIQTLYDGLIPGGILILSEKIVLPDNADNERMIDVYHDFKRANGYSELEVAQKRSALENVLIPETVEQHVTRLQGAGFESAVPWFQLFNFTSLVAIKTAMR